MKTEVLYKSIIEKLEKDPNLDISNIAISIKDNGIVILGGEVSSYYEKIIVENIIKTIHGVKGITDELKVNIALSYARKDIDILKDILNVYKNNSHIPEKQIKIVVENGAVILSGKVNTNAQKNYAEEVIQNVVGVIGISNNIIVISTGSGV